MKDLNTFLQKLTVTPDVMKTIFDDLTKTLYDMIAIEKIKRLFPIVLLYYLDYKENDGEVKCGLSVFDNLAETAQDRMRQFFEIGKDWFACGLRIPLCICFLTEVWKGVPFRGLPPCEQDDRKEMVMLNGLSINRINSMRLFNINRSDEGVLQLSEYTTICIPKEDHCNCPPMLVEFYQGYFAGLEDMHNAQAAVIH